MDESEWENLSQRTQDEMRAGRRAVERARFWERIDTHSKRKAGARLKYKQGKFRSLLIVTTDTGKVGFYEDNNIFPSEGLIARVSLLL